MKQLRVLLSLKGIGCSIRRMLHPNAESRVRLNGNPVAFESLSSIGGFVALYLTISGLARFALVALGIDPVASSSGAATCMAGCGPGLAAVGPMSTYAHLPDAAKWILGDACCSGGWRSLRCSFCFIGVSGKHRLATIFYRTALSTRITVSRHVRSTADWISWTSSFVC